MTTGAFFLGFCFLAAAFLWRACVFVESSKFISFRARRILVQFRLPLQMLKGRGMVAEPSKQFGDISPFRCLGLGSSIIMDECE